MPTFPKLSAEIFRDYEVDGVPSSGAHKPIKGDIRTYGATIEAALDPDPAAGGIVSVLDYGADPTGALDSTTAFQNAVNALPRGGVLLIPGSGYNISGTVTIPRGMTICGGSSSSVTLSAGITATGASNTVFAVHASGVTFRDLFISRAGSPTGNAFDVGTNTTLVNDAAMANGSPLLNSATANFTSADLGKNINVTGGASGGGPLLTTISSISSPTQAVLADNCTNASGISGAFARYGTLYSDFTLDNCIIYNHAIGANLQTVSEYHIRGCRFTTVNCLTINNQTGQGNGTSDCIGNIFQCQDNSSYGVIFNAGSDVRFGCNKFLGGIYCFYMNWNQSGEGNLIIADGSMEGFTTYAIFITAAAAFQRVLIVGNSISGPAVSIDNGGGVVPLTDVAIVANSIRVGSVAGTGISIGQAQQVAITGNVIDLNTLNVGIALLSNSIACNVSGNVFNCATNLTNAGSGNVSDVYPVSSNAVLKGVNFNSANTDNAIAIPVPNGAVGYLPITTRICNASHDISTATFGLFTAAAGGGTPIIAGGTAITVTATALGSNNNAMNVGSTNAQTLAFAPATTPLYFRVGTAEGAAATADVVLTLTWLY